MLTGSEAEYRLVQRTFNCVSLLIPGGEKCVLMRTHIINDEHFLASLEYPDGLSIQHDAQRRVFLYVAENTHALPICHVQLRPGRSRLGSRLASPAHTVLDELGLGTSKHVKVSEMAYGQRRQLELAMVLATQPKLMLLDEPLAGMSGAEADAMIGLLSKVKQRCSIVLIEHDMDAVFSLADRVTVLVYGKPIASGTPEEIQQNATVRSTYLGDETVDDFAVT